TPSGQPVALFDINSAESIAYSADGNYAYVLFNNRWLEDDDARDPYLGAGGNIGILEHPFSAHPRWLAATIQVPWSWPDDIALGPDNRKLFATFRGVNEVRIFDSFLIQRAIEFFERWRPEALLDTDRPLPL